MRSHLQKKRKCVNVVVLVVLQLKSIMKDQIIEMEELAIPSIVLLTRLKTTCFCRLEKRNIYKLVSVQQNAFDAKFQNVLIHAQIKSENIY